jgi:hypothetical protein
MNRNVNGNHLRTLPQIIIIARFTNTYLDGFLGAKPLHQLRRRVSHAFGAELQQVGARADQWEKMGDLARKSDKQSFRCSNR